MNETIEKSNNQTFLLHEIQGNVVVRSGCERCFHETGCGNNTAIEKRGGTQGGGELALLWNCTPAKEERKGLKRKLILLNPSCFKCELLASKNCSKLDFSK